VVSRLSLSKPHLLRRSLARMLSLLSRAATVRSSYAAELMRRAKDVRHLSAKEKHEIQTGFREFRVGTPVQEFCDNKISTTKYTVYNFVFKNLFEQFSKLANVYFLFLAILQCIPAITMTDSVPTILMPLLTIVIITMCKDGYEDYKRYKSDQEENNKEVIVMKNGEETITKWKDVLVGDLLLIKRDQFFPADLVKLGTSHFKKGQCYIETKNLDGETNLKTKSLPADLQGKVMSKLQVRFT
jgi:phospholipid-transporting ATPase